MGRLQVKVVGTGDSCTVENKKASVKMKDRASAGGGDDKTLGGGPCLGLGRENL